MQLPSGSAQSLGLISFASICGVQFGDSSSVVVAVDIARLTA
jgi:hypothetical protein